MKTLSSQALLKIAAAPAVLGIALLSTPAHAQDPQSAEAATEGDVIIVTGSRIARPELEVANPIVAVTAAAIEATGQTNVADILIRNPALSTSQGGARSGGADVGLGGTGLNLLDLRNLGTSRTLVLVNGKRHVSGQVNTAAVDVNTIPQDLIEKVDVLTGGASAVYGADGVSGVVNFIMKRDYEGFTARAQAGISSRGDAGSQRISVLGGKNFFDGRANLTAAYEFNRSERLHANERLFSGSPAHYTEFHPNIEDGTGANDDPNVYDKVPYTNLTWDWSSPHGVVDLANGESWLGNGEEYVPGIYIPSGNARAIGGTNSPLAGYFGDLMPATEQHIVNVMGSYEFSPAARLYAEAKYVNAEAFSVGQPGFELGTRLLPDNAFLVNAFGPQEGRARLWRDNLDFGYRGETNERETYRAVVGLEGELTDNLRYDISYVYGRTKTSFYQTNNVLADRYFAALDAVVDPSSGQIVCRSTLDPTSSMTDPNFMKAITTFTPGAGSACRPLNLLGSGAATQEALDFIRSDNVGHSRIAQEVISGYISGDTGAFFRLPGGPVGFAVGAEYRSENSRNDPDPAQQRGEIRNWGATAPSSGSFNVKEVFGEVSLPILADMPFAEVLTLGAAARLSDYSTVGSTTTWKVDGVWAPIRDIRFRATYSQAVRAPNIGELFRPASQTFLQYTDPCDVTERGNGTQYRPANCETLLSGLGLSAEQIATFTPDQEASTSRRSVSSGNRGLSEETAKTWTVGTVLQPRFIPGLTLTFDWYDITIEDAIATSTASDLAELCVDQPTLDNVYCESVFRSSDAGPRAGFILGDGSDPLERIGFIVRPENVAQYRTSGADFSINYAFTPAANIGRFAINVVGGYLDHLSYVPSLGADADVETMDAYNPKWRGNASVTWSLDNFSINYGVNYWSKTRRFSKEEMAANPDDLADPKYLYYKERWEHDIRAAVEIDNKFELYGGVNNLFDQEPDLGQLSYPISGVGRYIYAGVKVGF